MDTIQLTGKFKIEQGTILKDPLVTILGANYDYQAMKVVLIVQFDNTQYKHVRELDPAVITDTDGLTKAQIKTIVNNNLTLKKQ